MANPTMPDMDQLLLNCPGLKARMAADAGKGLSEELVDYAYWLGDRTGDDSWIMALVAIDNHGEKEPLLGVLTSEYASRAALFDLADLLERHQLERKKGGQANPAYGRTGAESRLELALSDMRRRPKGMSVEEAARHFGKLRRVKAGTLVLANEHRLGSANRRKKRLPGPQFKARLWPEDLMEDDVGIAELKMIDKEGDKGKGPLLTLLRSGSASPYALFYLADLLVRRQLKRGKRTNPSYDPTGAALSLGQAVSR